jgi:Ca2+-binding RTX toxin-like protein
VATANDTIPSLLRTFGSTITTGAGSDTIELAHMPTSVLRRSPYRLHDRAGGDILRPRGDGSLLSLLSGWDGSSNPFGSSGSSGCSRTAPTPCCRWDQDGTAGGANWETLVVFAEHDRGAISPAPNFAPALIPPEAHSAGETINRHRGRRLPEGTIGGDTINALGGADFVNGLAAPISYYGGDGADNLYGGNDDDFYRGRQRDDSLSGTRATTSCSASPAMTSSSVDVGNDQLSGGDGFDTLVGDAGNDTITAQHDDTLRRWRRNDFLSGDAGADCPRRWHRR